MHKLISKANYYQSIIEKREMIFCVCLLSFVFCLLRAAPKAYGGSQARGWIGARAAGLQHSQSNSGSKPRLGPTPQLTAMPDPFPSE